MYYTFGNSAAFEEKDSHRSQDFFALSSSRPTCWINASKDCLMSIWKISNLCFNSWSSKQSNWQCYHTTIRNLPPVGTEWLHKLAWQVFGECGGVYMRKLTLARVSYWDDLLISYHVYIWLGHFISCYLKVHFTWIKYTCDSKSQTLRMRYLLQSVVVSRLNDTVVRFHTGVNLSPQYNKQGELTLGFLVNRLKMRIM